MSTIPPPHPRLVEATAVAPERNTLPVPAQMSKSNSLAPGVIESDNPLSPATLIPTTDTLSTRPTKGGIAYPFSLKVDGSQGKHVNASTVTLQSLNITTPPATEVRHGNKQSDDHSPRSATGTPIITATSDREMNGSEPMTNEQHEYDDTGARSFSNRSTQHANEGIEKVERPTVERFETALEDLDIAKNTDDRTNQ